MKVIPHKQNTKFLSWSLKQLAQITKLQLSTKMNFGSELFSKERKETCMNIMTRISEEYSQMFRGVLTNKSAAVLVPFCLNAQGESSVLLTVRSRKLTRHGGLICFPGGISDECDVSLTETALRETHEELGILPSDVDVWGPLHAFPPLGSSISVTAIVGFVKSSASPTFLEMLRINHDEVEEVFLPTLESLCDPKCWEYMHWKVANVPEHVSPVFKLTDDISVWGLTAKILHLCLLGVVPEAYNRDSHISPPLT